MKIEKISDTQIKLVLTNEELDEKDISIEGIRSSSYRTKEALNNLVRDIILESDMMVSGSSFISVDIADISGDSVTFILSVLDLEAKSERDALKLINELFKSSGYSGDEDWDEYEAELRKHLLFNDDDEDEDDMEDEKPIRTATKTKDKSSSIDKKPFKPAPSKTKPKPITYVFPNMEFIAKVASLFNSNKITFADSKVYKMDTKYFLILNKKSTTKIEKAEAILSEYGSKANYHEYVLDEHGELVIKKDALNILNKYF